MRMIAALAIGVCGLPLSVQGATLAVSNTGVDSGACGPSASPCRSITRAITNASSGDRIVVHPGHYSEDLDRDGIFGEPGEEGSGINITKPLTIESTGGAAATFINKISAAGDAIAIFASNVAFGKLNKGFTLRVPGGANTTGISVVNNATGVVVAGNVVVGPVNFGIGLIAIGTQARDNRIVCSSNSGIGFFAILGTGTVIDRNTVEGCGQGFVAGGPGLVLTRNLAIGNNSTGFNLADFTEFTRNAAIGNVGAGVVLNSGSTPGLMQSNTFAGNGLALGANCGVQNNTGGTVIATGNFWGAPTGPGADPADQVCNAVGSTTVTSPFATTDFTPAQSALR